MLSENIVNEVTRRKGEKTGAFLTRQQMVRNVIRQINALEVHLGHLLSEEERPGRVGDSLPIKNEKIRNNPARQAEESVSTIA